MFCPPGGGRRRGPEPAPAPRDGPQTMAERQGAWPARGEGGDLLFERAPVALWLEDLSAVRGWLDDRGVRAPSVAKLFAGGAEVVVECLRRVRVLDVNEAAVRLYGAPGREALLAGLERIVRAPEVAPALAAILEALLAGRETVTVEARQRTWEGAPLEVALGVSLLPQARDDWSRVLVAVRDLTSVARVRDRLRALHEATPDAVLVRAGDGRVADANGAAARILGCAREDLPGMPLAAFAADAAAREALEAAVRRALREGAAEGEWTARGCDGREFPAEVRLRRLPALPDEGTGSPSLLCVLRDVGERREAERALRESEAKFRDLAEKSLVGVYLIQDGVLRYANPRLAEIFGYRVEEIVEALPVSALVHPEDRALVAANVRRRLAGEVESLRYRFRGLRRDGSTVHVEVYGTRTLYRGRPAVLGTLLDITAQLEAEAGERRLREGLLVLGLWSRRLLGARSDERRFREVACEGACELVGARAAVLALAGNGERAGAGHEIPIVAMAGDAADVAGLKDAVRAAARKGSAVRAGPGVGRHVLALPVQAEGETAGALAVALPAPPNEVTERLLGLYAERLGVMLENLRLLRSLEERVARRTSQLELANRELESFAYSVSHDLRAPLRAIDGFARAVLEDHGERLPPEGRAYLERVCHAAERMGRLIDDLLALSRVTRREMHRRPVDLSALARAVADELAVDEPGREVEVRIAPGLTAEADPGLVRLLLENLLRNAWKYTRPRERARVEFGAERGAAGETVFYVRDNGVGFDPRHAGRLFQPFQRLHRDEEFEGTGIGLATAFRVVRRHGGRIWAEAEPGRGAVFRFTLEPGPGGLTEGGPGL